MLCQMAQAKTSHDSNRNARNARKQDEYSINICVQSVCVSPRSISVKINMGESCVDKSLYNQC